MEKIRLEILGMQYSQSQSGAYALVLGEKEGKRKLPIIIGGFEAQSIAIELEKIKTPRPLTHDLFKAFADEFHVTVSEVIINKFHEGVFYAILVCNDGKNEVEIDSRTSDAIALSLRFGCPVYTYESILVAAGIMMDDDTTAEAEAKPSEEEEAPDKEDYSEVALHELQKMLQEAVEGEEYEKASQIRDEIKKRTKGKR
jgi:uncharacterized protein